MQQKKTDELEAGLELDRLVGKEVMGLDTSIPIDLLLHMLPRFSISISAAWLVFLMLPKTAMIVREWPRTKPDEMLWVIYEDGPHFEDGDHLAMAETVELAICKAALRFKARGESTNDRAKPTE